MIPRLSAFVIGRRAVAAAVFSSRSLEHCEMRHLPEDPNKAIAALVGFIHYIVDQLAVQSGVIDSLDERAGKRSVLLSKQLVETLRSLSVSVHEVPKGKLLEVFGHPNLKSREELGQICRSFWPHLYDAHELALEAAALGLYVQVERLLEINMQPTC